MKQKFTVITSEHVRSDGGHYYDITRMYRVTADSAQSAYDYYKGDALFIFEGHPPLEGEKGGEDFLKVIDIPSSI